MPACDGARTVPAMSDDTVLAAYDATAEAADGLALAEVLAGLTNAEILVARVLQDMVEHPGPTRGEQRRVRRRMEETRQAVVAAVPSHELDLMPVLDVNLARALHDVATNEDASFLVMGSSHHHGLGRILLGGSAELVIPGSPCPVAVATPGFRDRGELDPRVVGVAFDGSPESRWALEVGASLAAQAKATLRLIAVEGDERAAAAMDALARVEGVGQEERVVLQGRPADELAAQTANLGLLVMGARGMGAIKRALLGSVSNSVLRRAHCPVVVCPTRR
jgi:nucleotide-binding universal stress UspA family protein